MEFFPKGSFLYQHSAALENFVNGVWKRASQSGCMQFTQHQFQRWDGIHLRTGYPIHLHISVILIFLLRTTLIVLGLFCMLYSDIIFVLIVVLELERVLCKFAPTCPSSPAQIITKVEPHKFLGLVWTAVWKIRVPYLQLQLDSCVVVEGSRACNMIYKRLQRSCSLVWTRHLSGCLSTLKYVVP